MRARPRSTLVSGAPPDPMHRIDAACSTGLKVAYFIDQVMRAAERLQAISRLHLRQACDHEEEVDRAGTSPNLRTLQQVSSARLP